MSKLSAEFASVLRCPVTGSRLEQTDNVLVSVGTDENGARYSYPIIDGIPMLLEQDATVIPAVA